MSFIFDTEKCAHCQYEHCMEERRQNSSGTSQAKFLLKLQVALACTFDDFVPGSDRDPNPKREYFSYLQQFKTNIINAGRYLFGDDFSLNAPAMAKLEDEIFEALEATTLWNAAAAWNNFMEHGRWSSQLLNRPLGAEPRPDRKIALVRLPRNYDATLLFDEATRARMSQFENALSRRDMELKLTCPDIVGIRIKPTAPSDTFLNYVAAFTADSIKLMENAYKSLEGMVSGPDFLFAVSVKKNVLGHQLYQPLFEANVLKYLVQEVLNGPAFRFYVHVGSSESPGIEGRYKAASLYSLLKGSEPQRAVDRFHTSESPLRTAQVILDDFPLFP